MEVRKGTYNLYIGQLHKVLITLPVTWEPKVNYGSGRNIIGSACINVQVSAACLSANLHVNERCNTTSPTVTLIARVGP